MAALLARMNRSCSHLTFRGAARASPSPIGIAFAGKTRPICHPGHGYRQPNGQGEWVRVHDARPYATKTTSIPEQEGRNMLAKQRLQRPLSPHLGIYKWQITSVLSTLMRISGVVLAGSLYIFGLLYLASPALGLDLSSSSLAASFGSLPSIVKVPLKFILALPLSYHTFNGIRFLYFDMAKGLRLRFIYSSGWTVVIASGLTSLALATLV